MGLKSKVSMAHRVPRVPRAAQLARPNGLVHAAFYEKWAQVDQLLQHGTADILERDNNGRTVLHHAATHGNVEILSRCLSYHAEVNAQDSVEETPLHRACDQGHIPCVVELLAAAADLNLRDVFGNTPLMTAAFTGRTSIVAILLNAQASVALTDLQGRTALHKAATCGHGQCTGALLQAGADLGALDLAQETALDLGQRARKPKAAAVLKQWANGKIRRFLLTGLEDYNDTCVNGRAAGSRQNKSQSSARSKSVTGRSFKSAVVHG